MALEPITRQEKIIAGQDLTPITRLEKFLKNFGGSGGGGGAQADLSQTDTTKPDYVKGVIRQESLPEGYPYKESNKTVIEWDGNAEGLETFGGGYYKVSDKVFTEAELIGSVASIYNYTTGTRDVELTDNLVSDGGGGTVSVITDGGNIPSIISSDGTSITAGTYFHLQDDSYIAKLIYGTETIHPIAEEFLPVLTSPNGTKYQLTVADDGTLSAVQV